MLLSLEVNNIIDNAVRLQWGIEQASDIGSIILPVNNKGESDSSSEEEESENVDFDQLKAEHCQMETCLKSIISDFPRNFKPPSKDITIYQTYKICRRNDFCNAIQS